jgi:hypothetical protein
VATRETSKSQTQATTCAIFSNSFNRVFRAARKETATLPKHWADGNLIEADHRQQQGLPSICRHFLQQAVDFCGQNLSIE